jgi:hypothetical protein
METVHPFDLVTVLFTDTFEPIADMDSPDDQHSVILLNLTDTGRDQFPATC